MPYGQILTESRGRVGIIRLNRPEKLNAWTSQMQSELCDQVERWNADDGIGAFVITGQGRAFCAGADLGGFGQRLDRMRAGTEPSGTDFSSRWTTLVRRSKPSVVAINGYAAGVGLTLALPCDVRLAAQGARMAIRFVKVGLVPELGSTRLLAQIVGLGHATDICLSGRWVEAGEAERIGLISAAPPAEELVDAAIAKADELANNPTPVVMLIKELLARNPAEPDLDAVMEREQVRDRLARTWPDHAEAVRAFQEKREPRFNQSRQPAESHR
jgi:enoyl-CoA hydratase/carnithine racemase